MELLGFYGRMGAFGQQKEEDGIETAFHLRKGESEPLSTYLQLSPFDGDPRI